MPSGQPAGALGALLVHEKTDLETVVRVSAAYEGKTSMRLKRAPLRRFAPPVQRLACRATRAYALGALLVHDRQLAGSDALRARTSAERPSTLPASASTWPASGDAIRQPAQEISSRAESGPAQGRPAKGFLLLVPADNGRGPGIAVMGSEGNYELGDEV